MLTVLTVVAFVFASLPAVMFLINALLFRRAPRLQISDRPRVSVLIPARNEEASIAAAVESALASYDVDLEVIVLDDHSEDATAAVVQSLAANDARLRLLPAPDLPPGWCGKQHACHVLSQHAMHERLCFLDADVRLTPDALSRMIAFQTTTGAPLVSGFPRQITVTPAERLLIPMIHYVLLGYLPIAKMRTSTSPAFAAGCGQLMLAERDAYLASGGHAAIRTSLHDGLKLPKTFRSAGLSTDIFDATDVARCRMYRDASAVWFGLAKNAVEGMAAPSRILVFTTLLLAGSVLPFALLPFTPLALPAVFLALAPRLLAARLYRQPWGSALLHPIGILALLAIQWYALSRQLLGRPAGWKGRSYTPAATSSASPG